MTAKVFLLKVSSKQVHVRSVIRCNGRTGYSSTRSIHKTLCNNQSLYIVTFALTQLFHIPFLRHRASLNSD